MPGRARWALLALQGLLVGCVATGLPHATSRPTTKLAAKGASPLPSDTPSPLAMSPSPASRPSPSPNPSAPPSPVPSPFPSLLASPLAASPTPALPPAALSGMILLPASILSDAGLGLISDNGVGVISNNGSAYRLAAASAAPAQLQVGLVGPDGQLLPGQSWKDTDATGHYAFDSIPFDQGFVVRARLTTSSKEYAFGALAKVPAGGHATVDVTAASTVVAEKALVVSDEQQQDLSGYAPDKVGALVAEAHAKLTQTALPDFTAGTKGVAAALDRMIQADTTLATNARGIDRNLGTPIGRTKTTLAGGFANPEHFAFDKDGNLFVASFNDQTLYKVPAGTSTPVVFGHGGDLRWMLGVACDPAGNVYVSRRMQIGWSDPEAGNPPHETPGTQVFKIDPTGSTVTPLAYTFRSPTGMAFDHDGKTLYIVQGYTTSDGGGELIAYDTTANTGQVIATGFYYPVAVAVDSRDHLFISHLRYDSTANSWLACISEVDPDHHVSLFFPGDAKVTGSNRIEGLAFDQADNLYAASDWSQKILKFNPRQHEIDTLLPFHQPNGLAFDAKGNLIVGDYTDNILYRVTP